MTNPIPKSGFSQFKRARCFEDGIKPDEVYQDQFERALEDSARFNGAEDVNGRFDGVSPVLTLSSEFFLSPMQLTLAKWPPSVSSARPKAKPTPAPEFGLESESSG
jgi:hypothetical protein